MNGLSKRQKEIVEAALKLISEGGIQALTMKNLANVLGITEPALYRHFENKHDILLNVLLYFKEETESIFSDIMKSDLSPIEKIKQFFVKHFEKFTSNPAIAVILFSEGIFQLDERLLHNVKALMNFSAEKLTEMIREGQRTKTIREDIPAEELTLILMGTLRLQVLKWRLKFFSFDLNEEGKKIWNSLERIIRG
ncbi:MAG: TetR/AcrR family transcriptional regulator [Candidatus Aminicenantes bacterium]|nr:TetR/AcrR family transcriptional regulator [Candidatus Aminicenantes bacterium]